MVIIVGCCSAQLCDCECSPWRKAGWPQNSAPEWALSRCMRAERATRVEAWLREVASWRIVWLVAIELAIYAAVQVYEVPANVCAGAQHDEPPQLGTILPNGSMEAPGWHPDLCGHLRVWSAWVLGPPVGPVSTAADAVEVIQSRSDDTLPETPSEGESSLSESGIYLLFQTCWYWLVIGARLLCHVGYHFIMPGFTRCWVCERF